MCNAQKEKKKQNHHQKTLWYIIIHKHEKEFETFFRSPPISPYQRERARATSFLLLLCPVFNWPLHLFQRVHTHIHFERIKKKRERAEYSFRVIYSYQWPCRDLWLLLLPHNKIHPQLYFWERERVWCVLSLSLHAPANIHTEHSQRSSDSDKSIYGALSGLAGLFKSSSDHTAPSQKKEIQNQMRPGFNICNIYRCVGFLVFLFWFSPLHQPRLEHDTSSQWSILWQENISYKATTAAAAAAVYFDNNPETPTDGRRHGTDHRAHKQSRDEWILQYVI